MYRAMKNGLSDIPLPAEKVSQSGNGNAVVAERELLADSFFADAAKGGYVLLV